MTCSICGAELKRFPNPRNVFFLIAEGTLILLLCQNGECGVFHDMDGNVYYARVGSINDGGFKLRYNEATGARGGSLCKGV